MTKAAAQQQVLAVRGFEGAPQLGELLTMAALELGELAGERGDDIAGLIRVGIPALGGARLLLGAQLLDALAEGGVAVEEVQRRRGGRGQAAEGDRLPGAQHVIQRRLGTVGSGGCGSSGRNVAAVANLSQVRRALPRSREWGGGSRHQPLGSTRSVRASSCSMSYRSLGSASSSRASAVSLRNRRNSASA